VLIISSFLILCMLLSLWLRIDVSSTYCLLILKGGKTNWCDGIFVTEVKMFPNGFFWPFNSILPGRRLPRERPVRRRGDIGRRARCGALLCNGNACGSQLILGVWVSCVVTLSCWSVRLGYSYCCSISWSLKSLCACPAVTILIPYTSGLNGASRQFRVVHVNPSWLVVAYRL
jgi:hypothetical protein